MKERPSAKALFRHEIRTIQRALSGKPLSDRRAIGARKIHRGAKGNLILANALSNPRPLMVSRLGTTETTVVEYFVRNQIDGECVFPDSLRVAVKELSGVFPPEDKVLSRFSRESLGNLRDIDVMAVRAEKSESSYWDLEGYFVKKFARESTLIDLKELVPLGNPQSWTRELKGKKVLVIHPFADTVSRQFAKRHLLFEIADFLPDCILDVLPAVQSVGDNAAYTGFSTWFEALESMKREIALRDFDVAIIGAGAYGLFLAAECKRQGKIGIHIGGASQLLFGIIGKRWSDPKSADSSAVLPFINEHWTGPSNSEVPAGASKVEGGCYWG